MTGDTHGDFSRLRPVAFREQGGLTKDDYLIICGDYIEKNIFPVESRFCNNLGLRVHPLNHLYHHAVWEKMLREILEILRNLSAI